MKTAAAYIDYATTCLELAKRIGPDVEAPLLALAAAWLLVAEEAMGHEATLVPAERGAAIDAVH